MWDVKEIGTDMVYRISKWNEVFERSDTRKLKVLSWVAVPTSFSSHGYQSMIDEFGDDAPSIYGAWCALVAIAASCPVRGTLANGRGNPLPISHISRQTGFPSSVFEKLIAWAKQDTIHWIEEIEAVAAVENPDFSTEKQLSGKSPDDLPATSRRFPESSRLPDPTQPNPTRHHPTQPNPTGPGDDGSIGGGDFDLSGMDWHGVKDRAIRLCTALGTKGSNVAEQREAWDVCAVAMAIDRASLIAELVSGIRGGNIKKPWPYVRKSIENACQERGVAFNRLAERLRSAKSETEKLQEAST